MTEPRLDDGACTVYLGDCLAVLPTLADDSVDAVVTDPPYGLGFMGKEWDSPSAGDFPMRRFAALDAVNAGASRQGGRQRASADYAKRQARDARSYQEWCEQWARECLRVLKPGGHLLAFGGTRTYHRLASAIEDAGFELRDCITWLYGSGFPKSLDVSKSLDKAAGAEREVLSSYRTNVGMQGGNFTAGSENGMVNRTAPSTDAAKEWAGWGTALKPASEPIVVARKSLVGTVAANVLEYRTGALNIDACRVDRASEDVSGWSTAPGNKSVGGILNITDERRDAKPDDPRRWPTNVVLDGVAADALDEQTGERKAGGSLNGSEPSRPFKDAYGEMNDRRVWESYGDTGGASRFFPVFRYEAKADQNERPRVGAVAHPTVKPVDLMRWLVRLVTPPGGLVLDPFLGSGTTAQACIAEGFRCVGIEREEDYLGLIEARLSKPIQAGFSFGEGVA